MAETLVRLETIIRERRISDPALSYVAKLTHAGRSKIAQKVGEEAVETVIAAVGNDRAGVISESADLMFHLSVLFADMDVVWADIFAELERRDGVSGIAEKAGRAL